MGLGMELYSARKMHRGRNGRQAFSSYGANLSAPDVAKGISYPVQRPKQSSFFKGPGRTVGPIRDNETFFANLPRLSQEERTQSVRQLKLHEKAMGRNPKYSASVSNDFPSAGGQTGTVLRANGNGTVTMQTTTQSAPQASRPQYRGRPVESNVVHYGGAIPAPKNKPQGRHVNPPPPVRQTASVRQTSDVRQTAPVRKPALSLSDSSVSIEVRNNAAPNNNYEALQNNFNELQNKYMDLENQFRGYVSTQEKLRTEQLRKKAERKKQKEAERQQLLRNRLAETDAINARLDTHTAHMNAMVSQINENSRGLHAASNVLHNLTNISQGLKDRTDALQRQRDDDVDNMTDNYEVLLGKYKKLKARHNGQTALVQRYASQLDNQARLNAELRRRLDEHDIEFDDVYNNFSTIQGNVNQQQTGDRNYQPPRQEVRTKRIGPNQTVVQSSPMLLPINTKRKRGLKNGKQ